MVLSITLNPPALILKLLEGKQIIDFEKLPYYHNLDAVLITALDKLLKRNRLDAKALKSYKIRSNLGKNSTSYKIAAAFIEGLKVKI